MTTGRARLKEIETELTKNEASLYGSSPRANNQLLEQKAKLQKERDAIAEDLLQVSLSARDAANSRLKAIGSHQRVGENWNLVDLPTQVIKAQTDQLIMTSHPKVWAAAHRGDQKAVEALRVLEYTVGANPTNIAQKIHHAEVALIRVKSASSVDSQEISAIETALSQLRQLRKQTVE